MITLFKFVNFATVIGVLIFLFRKYGAALLFQKMAEDEQYMQGLQERLVSLEREKNILDERLEQDKQQASLLEAKIATWVVNQQQQEHNREDVYRFLQTQLHEKHRAQKKYIQQQWLAKKVIPLALRAVEEQLQKEYASHEKQEHYTNALIQMMRER